MSFLNSAKHYIRDLFRYPDYKFEDRSYNTYWHSRDIEGAELNSFQKARVDLLLKYIDSDDSILDVGCGDGKILRCLREKGFKGEMLGIDSSSVALHKALDRGIPILQKDISDPQSLSDIPRFDYVFLFEVLEHLSNSEELLRWAVQHARKGVVFSVPNSGFFVYRLRLFLGRFPLQWRVHPSEHLRFWTLRDMCWWLNQLGYHDTKIVCYEGIPVLNKIWQSLFSAGILVAILK